jgi:hypothetical protein
MNGRFPALGSAYVQADVGEVEVVPPQADKKKLGALLPPLPPVAFAVTSTVPPAEPPKAAIAAGPPLPPFPPVVLIGVPPEPPKPPVALAVTDTALESPVKAKPIAEAKPPLPATPGTELPLGTELPPAVPPVPPVAVDVALAGLGHQPEQPVGGRSAQIGISVFERFLSWP